jgi:hypothetical protein
MSRTTYWAILLPLLFSACSGGGGGASLPLADYLAQLPAARCAMAVACGRVADRATCEAWTTDQAPSISAAVASGKLRYDGKAAAACLDQYNRADCSVTAQAAPSRCPEVIEGNVAPGGACSNDDQCANGSCQVNGACAAGTCCAGTCVADAAAKPIGAACQGSDRCVGDAYCEESATGQGTCRNRLPAGSKCDLGQLCARGSSCLDGTCRRPVARGASCATTYCDDIENDVCDPTTKTCVPRTAVGAACSSGSCVRYASCDLAAGKCVTMGQLGDPCFNGLPCQPLLQCLEAVCAKAPQEPVCP